MIMDLTSRCRRKFFRTISLQVDEFVWNKRPASSQRLVVAILVAWGQCKAYISDLLNMGIPNQVQQVQWLQFIIVYIVRTLLCWTCRAGKVVHMRTCYLATKLHIWLQHALCLHVGRLCCQTFVFIWDNADITRTVLLCDLVMQVSGHCVFHAFQIAFWMPPIKSWKIQKRPSGIPSPGFVSGTTVMFLCGKT